MSLVMSRIMNRLTVAGVQLGGGGYAGRLGASI